MPGAGDLRGRLRFERRTAAADDYGNVASDFAAQFERAAEIKPIKGGEEVMAARLGGRQPALIRVRFDSETATIMPDWRAVDTRTGQVWAIHTAVDMERRREWITMTAEVGVAA